MKTTSAKTTKCTEHKKMDKKAEQKKWSVEDIVKKHRFLHNWEKKLESQQGRGFYYEVMDLVVDYQNHTPSNIPENTNEQRCAKEYYQLWLELHKIKKCRPTVYFSALAILINDK